jgi:hypothetical protein
LPSYNCERLESYYAPNHENLEQNNQDPVFQDVLNMLKINTDVKKKRGAAADAHAGADTAKRLCTFIKP